MLSNQRLSIALVVLALHGICLYCISRPTTAIVLPEMSAPEEPMVMVLIKSRLTLESSATPFLPRLSLKLSTNAIVDPDLPVLETDRPLKLTTGVGTLAAGPGGSELPDSKPFAIQAGLSSGQGATVVLRIEVLDDNEAGRIVVEVSGGSAAIDTAAIAFARAMPWIGAVVDGKPVPMEVRYAVHLQA